ncbi:hypothetical protein [Pectobacterium versatile]|uniref:Uncharacterized protein n=1 Tax=Pectobacterium versatile TaxID=2488639 RepID=A0A855MJ17_9GAMM|nr:MULTISPECIES: hypothetical protein [Pectobacterium]GKV79768.1 hypothetical protein PEC106664_05420 [Pectobacterium carotovorum subsp. carotovorum]ASN84941.1 Hypothetical protein SCC1_1502 [Pectobacterium versatile]AVT59458.1 hypothetical protein OA04_29230 [Pectobacterium versatile]POY50569.1 hypothetical protein F131LOC_01451 [Pectobacterium versatile]POY55418.1 hypothetical protein F018LOC_01345 [Pectobacterium versatile]
MSKKQTFPSTNSSYPDWMTISEAVEMTNTKGLGIKKMTFTDMHYMVAFVFPFTFNHQ